MKLLLVGLSYTGPTMPGVEIDTLGFCRAEASEKHAAYPLYEYNAIIVNPESYSHFFFGKRARFLDRHLSCAI